MKNPYRTLEKLYNKSIGLDFRRRNSMKFNELSLDIQSKLIDETLVSDGCGIIVGDLLNDRMNELFSEYFGKDSDLDLFYSLSHLQGDGVCFIGTLSYDELENLPFSAYIKDVENTSIRMWQNSLGNHYSHKNTVEIDIDTPREDYTSDEWNVLEREVRAWFDGVCDQLEKDGYEFLDSLMCEEAVREHLMLNNYFKDGTEILP